MSREPYQKPTVTPLNELDLADEFLHASKRAVVLIDNLDAEADRVETKAATLKQAMEAVRTQVSVLRGLALKLDAVRRLKEEHGLQGKG